MTAAVHAPDIADAPVLVSDLGQGVWRVSLNRPRAANAVNGALTRALVDIVREAESNDAILAVILASSQPGIFCAGADLPTIAAGRVSELFPQSGGFAGLVRSVRRKPWIALIDGPAIAGGMELALACDLIVCSTRARFSLPEVTRGLAALAGGVQRLPSRISAQVAFDMLLTGEPIDGHRAYQLGLASRIAQPEEVETLALSVARAICRNAPGAVRDSLASARCALTQGEEAAWAVTPKFERSRLESAELQEGIQAFLEKRGPRWGS